MHKKLLGLTWTVAIVLMGSACTVQDTNIPGLSGPSELGQSIRIEASPDTLTRNGYEQSRITVTARDHNGAPKPNVAVRIDMMFAGEYQDLGTLVPRNLRTGSDGQATAVYTAPPPVHPLLGGLEDIVTIVAVPVGTNAQSSMFHATDIRLMRPGVILAPADTPTASFNFSPASPAANSNILFDASASCAGSTPCSGVAGIANFAWRFGDGATGGGQVITHSFALPGTYSVTLTVTNDRGISDSETRSVTVGASAAPTARIIVSPETVTVGDSVFFTATDVTAGTGRSIVSYVWNFGDGKPNGNGASVTHVFDVPNTYTVVLTVTDDIGQSTTVSESVEVGP
jgi:PKD repeat protein